jgi:hypothetical protein
MMGTMDIPWKTLAAVEKDREYLALLSYLPLNRHGKIPAFMRFSMEVKQAVAGNSWRDWVLDAGVAVHAAVLDACGPGRLDGADGFRAEGAAL